MLHLLKNTLITAPSCTVCTVLPMSNSRVFYLFGNPKKLLIPFLAISMKHPQPMVPPPIKTVHDSQIQP